MKKSPVLFEKKELCCGCTACQAACPQNAIHMVKDEEGFNYPTIDRVCCVSCLKCEKVCPIKIQEQKRCKIAIITLYDDNNIGNKLQNFAVQEILLNRGYEVRTIVGELEGQDNKNYILQIKRYIARIIAVLGWGKGKYKRYALDVKRRNRFKRFSEKYLLLGEKINIFNLPNTLSQTYDCFVVGSDQVWHNWTGSEQELYYFFLQFTDKKKRICIAPSFGFDAVPSEERDIYIKGLEGFEYLSCREESGVALIRDLTGKSAELLIDPTMYIPVKTWHDMEKKPSYLQTNEKYMLVYLLGNGAQKARNESKIIAQKNKLRIIDIFEFEQENFYLTNPEEFLYLVENAEIICTDSFHGCVFSILFHKNFLCFNREGTNAENMENRLSTLLGKFCLKNRMFDEWVKAGKPELTAAVYYEAEKILKEEKMKFDRYLDEVFNNEDRR